LICSEKPLLIMMTMILTGIFAPEIFQPKHEFQRKWDNVCLMENRNK